MNVAEIETKLREMGLVQRTSTDGTVVWFLPEQAPAEPAPKATKTIEERVAEATERYLDAEWHFDHWEEQKTSREYELTALRMVKQLLHLPIATALLRSVSHRGLVHITPENRYSARLLEWAKCVDVLGDNQSIRVSLIGRRVLALLNEFAPVVEVP